MLNFDDAPCMTPNPIIRAAGETERNGKELLRKLVATGRIKPKKSLSGRPLLTTNDGRTFWEALHGQT